MVMAEREDRNVQLLAHLLTEQCIFCSAQLWYDRSNLRQETSLLAIQAGDEIREYGLNILVIIARMFVMACGRG